MRAGVVSASAHFLNDVVSPCAFGSGAAAPLGGLPTWIQDLMQFNPLRHWFEWLTAVYTSTPPAEGTIWKSLAVLPVAALAAWVGLQNSKHVVS